MNCGKNIAIFQGRLVHGINIMTYVTFPEKVFILHRSLALKLFIYLCQHILEVASMWIENCFIIWYYFCHITSTSFVTWQFMFTLFK